MKCYLKTFLPKQHFHAGASLVVKASMMVAYSSFQGPLKYVSSFNELYAIHYLVHVLQSKQQVHVENSTLTEKHIYCIVYSAKGWTIRSEKKMH